MTHIHTYVHTYIHTYKNLRVESGKPLSTGQKSHTDTVPVSPTKKTFSHYIPTKTALDTAYHTTDKRNNSQYSFNDKVNTADGLKLTLPSIQGI
jgi:hypothetical protein